MAPFTVEDHLLIKSVQIEKQLVRMTVDFLVNSGKQAWHNCTNFVYITILP